MGVARTEISQEARVRRLKDTLFVAGNSVIALSLWGVVKLALYIALTDEGTLRQVFSLTEDQSMGVLYIAAAFVAAIDLLVRVYIGLSARSEARDKRKSPFYLVVAVLAASMNLFGVITTAAGMAVVLGPLDAIVSVVIELTALAGLALVLYCSIRLRALNKATG